jgi:hypothetical protein
MGMTLVMDLCANRVRAPGGLALLEVFIVVEDKLGDPAVQTFTHTLEEETPFYPLPARIVGDVSTPAYVCDPHSMIYQINGDT